MALFQDKVFWYKLFMPYISAAGRTLLNEDIARLAAKVDGPGRLNYIICMLVKSYIQEVPESYANYNAMIGALECAKLELYRRMAAPYEDLKSKQNGDVF